MKAIVYTEYGSPDVLKIKEIDKPQPKENEILVKINAAHVNYGDLVARNFGNLTAKDFNMPYALLFPSKMMFGYSSPKKQILGSEFSGVVEGVGSGVDKFKAGDEVFGYTGQGMGANAEYVCVDQNKTVALKPKNMNHVEASTVPYGSIIATNLLIKIGVQPRQKVLVIGASGSIGSYAVQFAKYLGAEVTGVCGTSMVDFVKALGADKVIDYKKEDFTQTGEMYDVVFDVLGKGDFSKVKNVLNPKGTYLLASFKSKKLMQMLWTGITGGPDGKKVVCALSSDSASNLELVKRLVEEGKIKTVIDKTFTPEQAAEAHQYAESGNKKGNVVIKFDY